MNRSRKSQCINLAANPKTATEPLRRQKESDTPNIKFKAKLRNKIKLNNQTSPYKHYSHPQETILTKFLQEWTRFCKWVPYDFRLVKSNSDTQAAWNASKMNIWSFTARQLARGSQTSTQTRFNNLTLTKCQSTQRFSWRNETVGIQGMV